MTRLIWIGMVMLAVSAANTAVAQPATKEFVELEKLLGLRAVFNKSLAITQGELHCQDKNHKRGYPSCTEIPVIVLEVPITNANPGGCIVVVPYQTLKVHYGKGSTADVTWKLFAPDKYKFFDQYMGKSVFGVSLDTPGAVWKRKSQGRPKDYTWSVTTDTEQSSPHTIYVGWTNPDKEDFECEKFDPVIINDNNN